MTVTPWETVALKGETAKDGFAEDQGRLAPVRESLRQ